MYAGEDGKINENPETFITTDEPGMKNDTPPPVSIALTQSTELSSTASETSS